MHKTGFNSITNIDISEVVIEQMKRAHKNCVWRTMDATAMDFNSEEFSVILDKGTLESLHLIRCGNSRQIFRHLRRDDE